VAVEREKKNTDYEYSMNGVVLESVEDLGVMISHDLKTSNQSVRAYANANKILGMMNRTNVNKHSDIMVKVYKSLGCPHVEYLEGPPSGTSFAARTVLQY